MTVEGRVMLKLLAEWQSLPVAERDRELGHSVIAAEMHYRGRWSLGASYEAWAQLALYRAPGLPIPFLARGQA